MTWAVPLQAHPDILATYEDKLKNTEEKTTIPKQPEHQPATNPQNDISKGKEPAMLPFTREVQDPLKRLK